MRCRPRTSAGLSVRYDKPEQETPTKNDLVVVRGAWRWWDRPEFEGKGPARNANGSKFNSSKWTGN